MDKTGADFEYSVGTVHSRLGGNAHPIQLNIGAEDKFEGIIDLIEMKEYLFDGEANEDYKIVDIRADQADRAAQ